MINSKQFFDLIDLRKEELYELLCNLIKINSESFGSYGNEKECAEYIAAYCKELGLETDVYSPLDITNFTEHPDYVDGRHLENRPNVTVSWKGHNNRNGLMLMAHSDTVPIGDRTLWTFDPLAGEVRDGKILGRGACDDKYAIATCLFLFKLLKEAGFDPQENLLFTAYCDEEDGGSHGALATVLRHPSTRIVNMDCKNFQLWNCAAGGQCAIYRFHVHEPVSSAKQAAEAFPIVMEVLEKFGKSLQNELENNRFFKDTIIPSNSLRYFSFRVGGSENDLGVGEVSFSIYTDRSKEDVYAEYQSIDSELQKRLEPLGIISDGFHPTTRFFHYGYAEPDCGSITDMQAAALEASGRTITPCGSCLSDLSIVLKHGSPEAFAFGIGRDFDAYGGAHQADEYIECDALLEYTKIMAAYILRVLG